MQNNIFSGLFIGQFFFTLKEVDSTNNYIKKLLSNSTPLVNGTVIMAENQFAGRGQQQNKWFTEQGKNLTFSIYLKPEFLPLTDQFGLTMTVSLGVYEALYPLLGEGLKIKWPNDIYYHERKLGGILIENMVQGSEIKSTIVGIGLNINQEIFPDYLPNAVSIKQILRQDYDLKTILAHICNKIEIQYLQLKTEHINIVRKQYLERLYWKDEPRVFKTTTGLLQASIKTVRENGLLVVNNNGEDLEFSFKEIEFIS